MKSDNNCLYGRMRTALEKAGQPIVIEDLHVAAHARSKVLPFVSNNLRALNLGPGLMSEKCADSLN